MALPLRPGPASDDVAIKGWAAITARVAWVLLAEGLKVRPALLRDARDHVVYHLDPATSLAHAEDRAGVLTRAFVAQARRRRLDETWPQDAEMPLSPRWRRALDRALSPLAEGVLRHHYADGRPFERLESMLGADRVALESARAGLREIMRRAAVADGLPIQDWPGERIDRLLVRLATFTVAPCPPLPEVTSGATPEHVRRCARCARLTKLLRADLLSPDDLVAPPAGARPRDRVRVMALHFHPDGRHHRARLARETGLRSTIVNDDLLVLDWSDADAGRDLLILAAEVGAPHRDHLRGAVVDVPGRWARHGVIGPAVAEGTLAVRSRSWGTVDGLGELPEPIPSPPSARRWWAAVAGLAAVATLTTAATLGPVADRQQLLEEARFSQGRGGIWTRFDVDERAFVTVVRQTPLGLDVVFEADDPAEKATLATGDGGYLLHATGTGVLLAASAEPLGDVGPLVEAARGAADPLSELRDRLASASPGAEVRVHRVR